MVEGGIAFPGFELRKKEQGEPHKDNENEQHKRQPIVKQIVSQSIVEEKWWAHNRSSKISNRQASKARGPTGGIRYIRFSREHEHGRERMDGMA